MNKKIVLKRTDNKEIEAIFKVLDITYIDKIMELEKYIIDNLVDKDLYALSEKEDFISTIEEKGKIIGCLTEDNELIAMGVYVSYGYNDHNYGYDLDIEGEKLLEIAQIESTVVRKEYRGNKLQKIICNILEEIAVSENKSIIAATVSPKNPFSLNTFLALGYTVEKEKLKYEGLKRYIIKKDLK